MLLDIPACREHFALNTQQAPLTCCECRRLNAKVSARARMIRDPMVALPTTPDGIFSRVIAIKSKSGWASIT